MYASSQAWLLEMRGRVLCAQTHFTEPSSHAPRRRHAKDFLSKKPLQHLFKTKTYCSFKNQGREYSPVRCCSTEQLRLQVLSRDSNSLRCAVTPSGATRISRIVSMATRPMEEERVDENHSGYCFIQAAP